MAWSTDAEHDLAFLLGRSTDRRDMRALREYMLVVARSSGLSVEDAEDVSSELMAYWFRSRDRRDWPNSPAGWVADAVKKRCHSVRRLAWNRRRQDQQDQPDGDGKPRPGPLDLAESQRASPEVMASLHQLVELPSLPEHVRRAALMLEEGWSWAEIAEILDTGQGKEALRKQVERTLRAWRARHA